MILDCDTKINGVWHRTGEEVNSSPVSSSEIEQMSFDAVEEKPTKKVGRPKKVEE